MCPALPALVGFVRVCCFGPENEGEEGQDAPAPRLGCEWRQQIVQVLHAQQMTREGVIVYVMLLFHVCYESCHAAVGNPCAMAWL